MFTLTEHEIRVKSVCTYVSTNKICSDINQNLVDTYGVVSFFAVAMNSRDRYKIMGLCKISRFIKQPCSSVCQKKRDMDQSC